MNAGGRRTTRVSTSQPVTCFSSFAGLDDILQQFFGGGFGGSRSGARRGRDVGVRVDLTLAEAATGVSREISFTAAGRCPVCDGSGSEPGHDLVRCPTCGRQGPGAGAA